MVALLWVASSPRALTKILFLDVVAALTDCGKAPQDIRPERSPRLRPAALTGLRKPAAGTLPQSWGDPRLVL